MSISTETIKLEIHALDVLAHGNSWIHRIDARIKLLVTVVFVLSVMSMNRYDIIALFPFFIYVVAIIAIGRLPVLSLIKKALIMSPFAIMIGVFNPFFDKVPHLNIYGLNITGGWISFISIILRFFLTVEAGLILVSVTGMYRICNALRQLGLPEVFVTQILFLYRYLFVLIEEGTGMIRAKELRVFKKSQNNLKLFGRIAGSLLLRTFNRAQRIYQAMVARGYKGKINMIENSKINSVDVIYGLGWIMFFIAVRFYNIPELMGSTVLRVFQ
ncbi:MAG: cobalt ECF transporter T component CbiQ [Planctomycetia bacterium]|nr:cobalt ECF transporter T component CbiQ [Planctomycetia bacterium]